MRQRLRDGQILVNHHIGIAAVSPTGAALFYQALSRHAAEMPQRHDELRFSVHNEPLAQYLDAINRDDWMKVGVLLRRSAELAARCGAKFCVTPDAAVQQAIQFASEGSPIPWLTMTDLVADAVAADKHKMVGIIGTDLVMNSSTFQIPLGVRGIQMIAPEEADRIEIDKIIYGELIKGHITTKSQAFATQVIAKLKYESKCGAVILASSETPLLVKPDNSPLPLYDASEILAVAALKYAYTN